MSYQKTCKNCKFFFPTECPTGLCRIRAPRFIDKCNSWPKVSRSSVCGEWKPRNPLDYDVKVGVLQEALTECGFSDKYATEAAHALMHSCNENNAKK